MAVQLASSFVGDKMTRFCHFWAVTENQGWILANVNIQFITGPKKPVKIYQKVADFMRKKGNLRWEPSKTPTDNGSLGVEVRVTT